MVSRLTVEDAKRLGFGTETIFPGGSDVWVWMLFCQGQKKGKVLVFDAEPNGEEVFRVNRHSFDTVVEYYGRSLDVSEEMFNEIALHKYSWEYAAARDTSHFDKEILEEFTEQDFPSWCNPEEVDPEDLESIEKVPSFKKDLDPLTLISASLLSTLEFRCGSRYESRPHWRAARSKLRKTDLVFWEDSWGGAFVNKVKDFQAFDKLPAAILKPVKDYPPSAGAIRFRELVEEQYAATQIRLAKSEEERRVREEKRKTEKPDNAHQFLALMEEAATDREAVVSRLAELLQSHWVSNLRDAEKRRR